MIIPLILYPWLAVSLVILGRRMWRKASTPRNTRELRPVDDTSQAVMARLATQTPAPPERKPATPTTVAPATRRGEPDAPPHVPRLPSLISLVEMVRGIALPCGLVPHLGGTGVHTPDRAAFTTTTSEAGEVEAGLRAELSRLGMADIRETSTGFVAGGQRGEVEVRVHRSVTAATASGIRAFDGALPDAIAVEMTVR